MLRAHFNSFLDSVRREGAIGFLLISNVTLTVRLMPLGMAGAHTAKSSSGVPTTTSAWDVTLTSSMR